MSWNGTKLYKIKKMVKEKINTDLGLFKTRKPLLSCYESISISCQVWLATTKKDRKYVLKSSVLIVLLKIV